MSSPASPANTRDPAPAKAKHFFDLMGRFWQRVTDGLAVNQLWTQFQKDARASYHMYSREIDPERREGERQGRHYWNIAKQFFWAILEKLSPARRVVLLLGLVLLLFNPEVSWKSNGSEQVVGFDMRLLGGLLIFLVLLLEMTDRVVMKRDLQIAREIQMWLLPSAAPQVQGLQVAFGTRPANTVAGDYYDVFSRPSANGAPQKYLITVADVAGKSIPAALLMATFQSSLKTLSETGCSLEELVLGMNRYACNHSQGGLRFTTAFIGEFDGGRRSLNYINAGHNAPVLRRKSGGFEKLEAGGLPLGIDHEAKFATGSIMLEPGDWLAIFTDGLVEAENQGRQEYGEERLQNALNLGAELGPPQMLSRIMVDLDMFIGEAPQHDDVTCMLLRAS